MKKLDLNSIADEVLDECFEDDEQALEALEVAEVSTNYKISLKRPEGVTNEELISYIHNGINVKKNTELLVRYNYGMIVDIASKCTCYIPHEDKVSYGVEGFMRAIKSYDPSKNTKFSTYASNTIYMTVYNEASDANYLVHFPRYMSVYNIQVQRFTDDYMRSHGRRPSAEVISEATGIEIHHVKNCMLFSNDYTQLDTKVTSDSNNTLADILSTDDSDYNLNADSLMKPLKHIIVDMIKELKPKEYELVCLLHGLDDYEQKSLRDLAEIGFVDDRGIVLKSRSNIHRKYNAIIDKLKKMVRSRGYEFEDF